MIGAPHKGTIRYEETYLGIELGSTRIKAVLIDQAHNQIASGSHMWENRLENGLWTYRLEDIWAGIQDCYAKLSADVYAKYGEHFKTAGAMGISAMMHGYMAFDGNDRLLVPFRTWRNTNTGAAAERLTELFGFNIPLRWSVSHLYQAVLNGEEHVQDVCFLTTLAGYIHWQLTGEKVLGIGDASGMFPIDDASRQFDASMLHLFNREVRDKRFRWNLADILPKVLVAGASAGVLTEGGARLLDPSGVLKAGIPLCPPEGDAGTGMAATNSVRKRTANISAGTSVFAMAVLEKPLSKVYPEIDIVTTPSGEPVAMVHCNNCTSDIDAWVRLLGDAARALGAEFDTTTLYTQLLNRAMVGDADCGGLLSYNYLSGEPVTGFTNGCPMFIRLPEARMNLANFMRTHLYSACAALKIGMEILTEKEHAVLDSITGHGGFFKVIGVGQRVMAAALNAPVTVMSTAGEGGPWGMAVLAAYMRKSKGETLPDYLSKDVFAGVCSTTMEPDPGDRAGFAAFMQRYKAYLAVEKAAVEATFA